MGRLCVCVRALPDGERAHSLAVQPFGPQSYFVQLMGAPRMAFEIPR